MIHNKLLTVTLAALAMAGTTYAATITSLGADLTTGADWRTATTAKSSTFDPNGDDIYGSDGYRIGYSALGAANTAGELSMVQTPSYVSSLSSVLPFFASNTYVDIDNPMAAGDINGGLYYGNGAKFNFTVSQATEFVLTVLIGQNTGGPVPTSISVNQTVGGAATATNNSFGNSAAADYIFFNIDAAAGDKFEVRIVSSNTAGITGVGFEIVPEPASLALLSLGGLMVAGRRRK